MNLRIPKRGSYTGRLAFDGEYHVDPAGRRVVTIDGGKSWRYAKRTDASHNSRYFARVAQVAMTDADRHMAGDPAHAHHHRPLVDDPHRDGVVNDPDDVAAKITSHTDAWKEAA